ncbi:bifunctional 5,10-methylenetetrahydrofolate dehydrogenase/5,10-methenyltetrahydrofolate cyclohydrolase [Candidatus Nomurabacteria bacterium]|nr:bifunctional 5,10-methylenetetrahydrofolate dehydrogenase/5,10-methenyltetrahydrofolate cyclohydrolase [Candidatus Nomurabacteria bacterium]
METKIIDGKKLREEILAKVKSEVEELSFKPVFCDVLVGDDPASIQYVQMKGRMAEEVGIAFHKANFPAKITTNELIKEIKVLNKIENMCGIITQLPLPEHIDRQAVLDAIDPKLDVDCLGKDASEKFYSGLTAGEGGFPTALACMAILDSLNLDLENKKIVVQGQGLLVGKPVAALLKFRGLHPEIITSKTENKDRIIKEADIIISGIGKGKYVTGDMIKNGAIIIDAGTSETGNGPADSGVKIVGDVDLESVKGVAEFVSPVPGGVGPVTVAMLLQNVLTVAKNLV